MQFQPSYFRDAKPPYYSSQPPPTLEHSFPPKKNKHPDRNHSTPPHPIPLLYPWQHLQEMYPNLHAFSALYRFIECMLDTTIQRVHQGLVRETGLEDHHKCGIQCPKDCTAHLDWGRICGEWLVVSTIRVAQIVSDNISRFM